MGGENQHLGYLNMLGSAGGIECHVGNVIASQWLYATVNIVGTLGVAMETDVGEIVSTSPGLMLVTRTRV